MKQRVAIARTLINKPQLVLMDEPFGALDPQTRWGMQSLLLDVSRTEDNTILFVTHDVSEAVYLADTIYVLAPRPTKILHRIDVPFFENHDIALKSSTEFRNVEKKLLRRLLWDPRFEKVRLAIEAQERAERMKTLSADDAARVNQLVAREAEINRLAGQNPSFTGDLLRTELFKTHKLVDAFLEM